MGVMLPDFAPDVLRNFSLAWRRPSPARGRTGRQPDQPPLRFVEENCVQWGMCATTCLEDGFTLRPRQRRAGEGHATFRGAAAEHPKTCNECRFSDMSSNPGEVRIADLTP